jgi:hypothetical protein
MIVKHLLWALTILVATSLSLAACGSSNPSTSTTSISSASPPLLMLASCNVGNFSFPTEDGDGPNELFAGERISVTDNWSQKTTVEVKSLVAVFYDNGKEVGSLLANGTGDTESTSGASAFVNALNPSPVYLTLKQSQTWTLPADWTGLANRCDVIRITSSPQVPQDRLGS